jgi:hypothetical protein
MTTDSANFLIENGITAFGLFAGIVAGALIQYFFHWLTIRRQKNNAIKILAVEIRHNLSLLPNVKKNLSSIKAIAGTQSLKENDLFIDMRLFNYRASDTLINHGWFHSTLRGSEIKDLFEFWLTFNNETANSWNSMLKENLSRDDYGNIVRICEWAEQKCEQAEEMLSAVLQSLGR